MKLKHPDFEIYIPDNTPEKEALARTTHLAVGAHQDDLEMLAVDGILKCYRQPNRWFCGVVVTDGSGSPRTGVYKETTDEEMKAVRLQEQKMAADLGEYGAQVFLGYPSSVVKDPQDVNVISDLSALIQAASPEVVYTHNLADKHPTHVGVAVKVIAALRQLPAEQRPKKVYGCEIWRDLDWMPDSEKVAFDCSKHTDLQQALLAVFDSQISGGKRYDLAALGRRAANATLFESHRTDKADHLHFAMDLTPLMQDATLNIRDYVQGYIQRFAEEVTGLIDQMEL